MDRPNRRASLPGRRAASRKRNNAQKITESRFLRTLFGAVGGILAGALLALLLLLLFSLILCKLEDPNALVLPLGLTGLFLSSVFVGIVSERITSAAFLPTGLVTAVLWCLISLPASLLIEPGIGSLDSVYALVLRLSTAPFVLFGAFLAKKRPRRYSPRRRKR